MAPRRILVPTDLSASADAALDHAVALASSLDGYILLLHAFEPLTHLAEGLLPNLREVTELARQRVGHALEMTLESRKRHGVPMSLVIKDGIPWRLIVETASEEDMDLIIMATHGRNRPHLMGNVTDKVLRMARCPVLTIPGPSSKTA